MVLVVVFKILELLGRGQGGGEGYGGDHGAHMVVQLVGNMAEILHWIQNTFRILKFIIQEYIVDYVYILEYII